MSGVRVISLCEDLQTDVFVRRFLRRRFPRREFRPLVPPPGSQSGEQWVREQYPDQLRAIRGKKDAYLIVVIDADKGTTSRRRAQLDAACDDKRVPRRSASDPVLIVVPRRNIETWFAYLGGATVDEETEYPRLQRERDCDPHANRLYAMCHEAQRLDEGAPPSLQEACEEYGRLRR